MLGECAPLPFQLDEPVGEETRLRYRYLDLRRDGPGEAIRLRSKVNAAPAGCWPRMTFAMMGIGAAEAQEKFGFLLDAFTFGAPPHGGIAFGWDRIVALLAGKDSIREVIAFPKSGGGVDPLTDAPAPITAQQRKESGIDAVPESHRRSATE